MAEDRSSGKRRGLAPGILLDVVDLHVVDWPVLRSSADQINVAVVIHADHGAIDRDRNVFAAVPAMLVGQVGVDVADGEFSSLPVDDIAAKKKNLSLAPQ